MQAYLRLIQKREIKCMFYSKNHKTMTRQIFQEWLYRSLANHRQTTFLKNVIDLHCNDNDK